MLIVSQFSCQLSHKLAAESFAPKAGRHRATPLIAFLLALLSQSAGVYALDSVATASKQPVMLTAREVGYDEKTATAVALGNVEIVQDDTIVLADRVTYNQNTDVVHATGHVSVLEPSGDVLFSDDAELKQSMEKGVVAQLRARLKDNSLFAAREAHKISKNVTRLSDAVYSPCDVCTPKPGEATSPPLWQMQAKTVTIDEDEKTVKYRNAFMDVYGVPVIYTPYFSHPTPDAPSKSGLLMPQYYHSTQLGNVVKEPVFISIAPNMDMTLTPWYISGERSPMLQGEFRHLTENGSYEIRGAAIEAYQRDAFGNPIGGSSELRDYIDAHGNMKLSEHWNAGMDIERTSDNTFLALYGLGWQDILTSRFYAERLQDRNYAVIESLAFQGLQPQDIGNQSPYILPQANLHLESDPLAAHSRLELDSNALVLERQVGDSDQRLSGTAAWKLPYVTKDGQVMELKASVRGDGYSVSNQTTNSLTASTFSGTTGRVIPEIDFNWRYPFINRLGEGISLMVAPVVEAAVSPDLQVSSKIPNEDSQIAELSDINLFSANRFTGFDEVESGPRGTYGMRGELQLADQKYIEWMAGQAYQEYAQSPFPIAGLAVAHFSDYIGRLALKYEGLDAAYSFRLDRESLTPISNEVTTSFVMKPVNISATYLSLRDEPLFGDRKSILGSTSVDITSNWLLSLSGQKDLGSSATTSNATTSNNSALNLLTPTNGTVGLGANLVFHNECVMITSGINRSYITQEDVKPSTTVSVMLVLKNFGSTDQGPPPPVFTSGAEQATITTGTDSITNTSGQYLFDNPPSNLH